MRPCREVIPAVGDPIAARDGNIMAQDRISPFPTGGSCIGIGDVEFADLGRRFVLCRARTNPWLPDPAPATATRLPLRFEFDGIGQGPEALLRRADAGRLRTLVSREEHFVSRMSDAQVRSAAAGLLRRGALTMFEVGARPAMLLPQAPKAAPASRAAVTVPRPPPSPPPRTAAVPAARPSLPPAPLESGLAPGIDQDAQAQVLIASAKDGVAFCEECMKRAQQRQPEDDEVLA